MNGSKQQVVLALMLLVLIVGYTSGTQHRHFHQQRAHTIALKGKDCGELQQLQHGSKTLYGDRIEFLCDAGYILNGVNSVWCLATGSWSAEVPQCQRKACGELQSPQDGRKSGGDHLYGDRIEFACDAGYNLNGETHLFCLATGSWSAEVPQCQRIDCGEIQPPQHGFKSGDGHWYGDRIMFACDAGHFLIGGTYADCLATGSWSAKVPQCQRLLHIDCGELQQPQHGSMTRYGQLYGYRIEFACDAGYNLHGDTSAVCLATGSWSSEVPQCQRKDCGELQPPQHGSKTGDGHLYEARIEFACDAGHFLNGDTSTLCLATGSWSAKVPQCQHCSETTLPPCEDLEGTCMSKDEECDGIELPDRQTFCKSLDTCKCCFPIPPSQRIRSQACDDTTLTALNRKTTLNGKKRGECVKNFRLNKDYCGTWEYVDRGVSYTPKYEWCYTGPGVNDWYFCTDPCVKGYGPQIRFETKHMCGFKFDYCKTNINTLAFLNARRNPPSSTKNCIDNVCTATVFSKGSGADVIYDLDGYNCFNSNPLVAWKCKGSPKEWQTCTRHENCFGGHDAKGTGHFFANTFKCLCSMSVNPIGFRHGV